MSRDVRDGYTVALDVKAELKTLVDSLPELAEVQRTWGHPGRTVERRWAFVGEVQWQSTEYVTNRSLEEIFAVQVGFSVLIAGGTAEDCERAAAGLATPLFTAVKERPQLGITNVVSVTAVPRRLNSWPVTEGFEAQFEIEIRVTARI